MEMAEYAISTGTELGVNPFDIIFEITEAATQRSGGHAATFVNHLNDAGYRVAIDDFGSGTTSLKQIRTLPFHMLKLDESLVLTLAKDAHDREFAKAICGLAHAIRLDVIAEFVEDEETMKFLGEIGVKYAQGYHLGKPEPFPLDPEQLGATHDSAYRHPAFVATPQGTARFRARAVSPHPRYPP